MSAVVAKGNYLCVSPWVIESSRAVVPIRFARMHLSQMSDSGYEGLEIRCDLAGSHCISNQVVRASWLYELLALVLCEEGQALRWRLPVVHADRYAQALQEVLNYASEHNLPYLVDIEEMVTAQYVPAHVTCYNPLSK